MKLNKFKQDLNLAEQGTTVDIGDGATVTVARIGNKNYVNRLKELTKPYKRQIDQKTLHDDVWERLLMQAMADTILLGWTGMENDDGSEMVYSKAQALAVLMDPEYADFRALVTDLANELEVFRKQEVEETTGK